MKALWISLGSQQCESISQLMAKTANHLITLVCDECLTELKSTIGRYISLLQDKTDMTKKDQSSIDERIRQVSNDTTLVLNVIQSIEQFTTGYNLNPLRVSSFSYFHSFLVLHTTSAPISIPSNSKTSLSSPS